MPLVRTNATILRKPLLAYAQEHTEHITADTVSCNLPLVPETGAICGQVGVFHKLQQGLLVANLVPQMAHYLCCHLHDALDAFVLAGACETDLLVGQGHHCLAHLANVHPTAIISRSTWDAGAMVIVTRVLHSSPTHRPTHHCLANQAPPAPHLATGARR